MKKNFEVNGITLCVEDSGELDKKPLLLYHGLTANKESMYGTAELFKATHRTICVDTRGHGESTHPEEYTLLDHAKDVHALIEAMRLEKPDILGLSMGSYVALAAAEYKSDDIDHLILVATKPSGTTSSVERICKEKGLDIRTISSEEFSKIMMSVTFAPDSLKKIMSGEMKFDFQAGGVELTPEEKDSEARSLANFDNRSNLAQVSCKTLVVSGEYDGINPKELGKEVADGIRDSVYVEIKNVGHGLIFEKPEEFKKIVSDFLNDSL